MEVGKDEGLVSVWRCASVSQVNGLTNRRLHTIMLVGLGKHSLLRR